MANNVYIGNDNLIELDEVKDASLGTYINDATASATIKTRSGTIIAGPIAMAYVAGSDGLYRGTIANDAPLTLGVDYIAEILVDGGPSLRGFWLFPITVVARVT